MRAVVPCDRKSVCGLSRPLISSHLCSLLRLFALTGMQRQLGCCVVVCLSLCTAGNSHGSSPLPQPSPPSSRQLNSREVMPS